MCPFFWSKPYNRLLSEKHLTISPCNNLLKIIKFPITIAELLIRSKYKIHCLERSVVSFFCFAAYSHYNQIFQVKMHLNNKTLFFFIERIQYQNVLEVRETLILRNIAEVRTMTVFQLYSEVSALFSLDLSQLSYEKKKAYMSCLIRLRI